MHTQEQRQKAVELFIECGKSHSAVINALGYGSRWSIDRWYQDYLKDGFIKKSRTKWLKFTDKEKTIAVKHFLENEGNALRTVHELGYPSRTLLYQWVDELAPGMRKRQRKRLQYPQEQKIATVVEFSVNRKNTVNEFAAAKGIDKVTLYNWRHGLLGKEARDIMADIKDEQLPDDVESLKELADDLKKEIRHLKMETAVWQGAAELVKKDPGVDPKNLTNREKTILIDALRSEFKLKELLRVFKMSRSSYYYQRQVMALPDKYADLRERVKEMFEESDQNSGYRMIWGGLRTDEDDPVIVSEKVIRKIMREEELQVIYIRKPKRHWSSYAGEISEAPENLVKRDFHADAPNKLWLTDITQFTLPDFKCYLSPVIDCFDGMVTSWNISNSPDAPLVNTMLKGAISTLKEGERPVIHNDRGVHYRWPNWIALCNDAGLTRSMSKKGCSPDNSACEGFFGRLKNEFFYYRDWSGIDYDTFAAMLNNYIVYYNNSRIKKSLGWMSPVRYRESLKLAA